MLNAVWLRDPDGGPGVLLLTAHVLAMDPASWRIVLGELESGWHALNSGRKPAAPREHTSLRQWSHLVAERALTLDSCDFWQRQLDGEDPDIGARRIQPATDRVGDVVVRMAFVEPDVTARVLAGPIPVTEVLAAATARTMNSWRRHRGQETPSPLLALETHGRADLRDTDTGDTVGLLSAIYPLRLPADDAAGVADLFAAIPGDGIDYALLRYLRADTAERLGGHRDPQVLLNYLGRIHFAGGGDAVRPDRALLANVSPLPEPNLAVRHELVINAAIVERGGAPVLGTQWRTLPDILSGDDVATLQAMWQDALREVIP
jgi:mycobactin peptide synthetase MbtF